MTFCGGTGNDLLLPLNILPLLSPPGTLSQCLNHGTIGMIPLPKNGFTPGLLSSSPVSLLLLAAFNTRHSDLDLPIAILIFTTASQFAIFPNPTLRIHLSTLLSGHPLSDHSKCQGYLYDIMMSSYSIMQILTVAIQGVIILLIK